MINTVIVEGIVARESWRYGNDLFFRLACYRDSDVTAKAETGREEPDYVNVRLPGGAGGLFSAKKGMRVRVHGYLQSRDFTETLDEFLKKSKESVTLPEGINPKEIKIDRNTVEVIATRVVLETPRKE